MNSWSNYSPEMLGNPAIYDDRFGYRYFNTKEERDSFYNGAAWIDQKHWTKRD